MPRPYYAIHGQEAIDLICATTRKILESSGDFGISRTFPQFSYKVTIEMDVYPSEPSKKSYSGNGEKKVSEPSGPPEKVVLSGGREGIGVTVAPDKVRQEENMPLSKPVTKKGMGTVDELMDSLNAK